MSKRVLLLTDNEILLDRFKKIADDFKLITNYDFDYAYSYSNKSFISKYVNSEWIRPIRIKESVDYILNNYCLVISLHCKQLFPEELVRKMRCINVHPGLNPFNRGWYPQVFSIINGQPCGATIHEMDEFLDHGPIICQKEVKVESWDTSLSVYNKILDAEIDLLKVNFVNILNNEYKTEITSEGNLNLKKDFDKLCEIDLLSKDSFLNHINILRALTHGDYFNAFFYDENKNKIFIKVELKVES